MKKIIYYLLAAVTTITTFSCTLDNYDAPDSGLYGSIIDSQTGETVEQDIIQGTKIYFVEQGYRNPSTQQMVIKNDGSYCNSMMFAGEYKLYTSIDSNFAPVDTVTLNLKGQTRLDIHVTPFIRLSNVNIFRNGGKIRAMFTVNQTGYDNISTIALFASTQKTVGAYLNDAKIVIPVGVHYPTAKSFTIDMELADFSALKAGKSYYFRAGALISVGGAKYNYAPAVKIDL